MSDYISNRLLNEYYEKNIRLNRDKARAVRDKVEEIVSFLVDGVHKAEPKLFKGSDSMLFVGSSYQKAEVCGHSDFDYNIMLDLKGTCEATKFTLSSGEVEIKGANILEISSSLVKQNFEKHLAGAISEWNKMAHGKIIVRFCNRQESVATRLKFCLDENPVRIDLVLVLDASRFSTEGDVLHKAEINIMKGQWVSDTLWSKMQKNLLLIPANLPGNDAYETWKISTAPAEVLLVQSWDADSTCRKKIFRLLKAINLHYFSDQHSSGLSSHMLLNCLLWEIHWKPDPSFWAEESLAVRFQDCLTRLLNSVKTKTLESYFTHLPISLLKIQDEKSGFHCDLENKLLNFDFDFRAIRPLPQSCLSQSNKDQNSETHTIQDGGKNTPLKNTDKTTAENNDPVPPPRKSRHRTDETNAASSGLNDTYYPDLSDYIQPAEETEVLQTPSLTSGREIGYRYARSKNIFVRFVQFVVLNPLTKLLNYFGFGKPICCLVCTIAVLAFVVIMFWLMRSNVTQMVCFGVFCLVVLILMVSLLKYFQTSDNCCYKYCFVH